MENRQIEGYAIVSKGVENHWR